MDLGQLGALLRRHRDRVRPEDVGLPAGARRTVPGLRRSEVARLAGTSPGYYAELEQGAGSRPSARVLAALARALRLGEDEHRRCCRLADRPAPGPGDATGHVAPGLLHLVDGLAAVPAQVVTDRGVVLVQNRLAALALVAPVTTGAGQPARVRVEHPVVGPLALQRRSLRLPDAEQRLVWFVPVGGTQTGTRLALLAVIGLQDLGATSSRAAEGGPGAPRSERDGGAD